jgi:hypothetical protein
MTGIAAHGLPNPLFDIGGPMPFGEKGAVLLPAQADHRVQAVALCCVEHPFGRWRIESHGIEAALGHPSEILFHNGAIGILKTLVVGPKSPICDASHIELLFT